MSQNKCQNCQLRENYQPDCSQTEFNYNFYPTGYENCVIYTNPMISSINDRTPFDKAYDLYYENLVAKKDYTLP